MPEFAWSPEQQQLRRRAVEVARAAVARHGSHTDSWMNGLSRQFSRELAALGWIGLSWPAPYGGGRPPIERFIVAEVLIAEGVPIAGSWFGDRQVGPALIAHGTPQQRDRFLPGIRAGEHTWCIGMSEPAAGSDLAALRTTARRDGDHWVVDGQKTWTSFAEVADFCYLICRTSSDGPPHRGISELVVPMDSPGITIRPISDMAGGRHFCEVFFDGVRVPAENLVGQEGAAFGQTMRQLEYERGGIDRLMSNHGLFRRARAAADLADPTVVQEVAALETAYRTGRLMVLREVLRQGPPGYSAVTKAFCTAHEQDVAAFVWQTLGTAALGWDHVGRGLAYSPSYTVMGGTNEILKNIVADRMLGLPRV